MNNAQTLATPPSQTSQVDTIVYLASLVSRPQDVDPWLDKVRTITAMSGPGGNLSDSDKQTLNSVQNNLEQYLVQTEPLRRFTPESLKQKLAERFAGKKSSVKTPVIIWLAIALIGMVLPFAFPYISEESKQTTSSISILTGLCLGAAWFFVTSVRDFKQELRAAYRLIAIGVVIFGLAMFATPLRTFLNFPDTEWRHLESIIFPFFFAHVPIYIGVRAFARKLGLQTKLTSVWLLLSLLLVGGSIVVFLPHDPTFATELFFDLSVVALVWCAAITFIGSAIMYKISKHVGELYAGPMRWLLAGYIMISLSVWEFLIIRFTLGYLPAGPLQIISYIPTLIGGILLFIAAAKFKRASMY